MDCFLYTEACHRPQGDFIAKRLRFWSPCDQKRQHKIPDHEILDVRNAVKSCQEAQRTEKAAEKEKTEKAAEKKKAKKGSGRKYQER